LSLKVRRRSCSFERKEARSLIRVLLGGASPGRYPGALTITKLSLSLSLSLSLTLPLSPAIRQHARMIVPDHPGRGNARAALASLHRTVSLPSREHVSDEMSAADKRSDTRSRGLSRRHCHHCPVPRKHQDTMRESHSGPRRSTRSTPVSEELLLFVRLSFVHRSSLSLYPRTRKILALDASGRVAELGYTRETSIRLDV
jgi:hypothetical protein